MVSATESPSANAMEFSATASHAVVRIARPLASRISSAIARHAATVSASAAEQYVHLFCCMTALMRFRLYRLCPWHVDGAKNATQTDETTHRRGMP